MEGYSVAYFPFESIASVPLKRWTSVKGVAHTRFPNMWAGYSVAYFPFESIASEPLKRWTSVKGVAHMRFPDMWEWQSAYELHP